MMMKMMMQLRCMGDMTWSIHSIPAQVSRLITAIPAATMTTATLINPIYRSARARGCSLKMPFYKLFMLPRFMVCPTVTSTVTCRLPLGSSEGGGTAVAAVVMNMVWDRE
jgi:hypothetical protein